MHVLDGSQQLVDDVLFVNGLQNLRPDDRVQICFWVAQSRAHDGPSVLLRVAASLMMSLQLLRAAECTRNSA